MSSPGGIGFDTSDTVGIGFPVKEAFPSLDLRDPVLPLALGESRGRSGGTTSVISWVGVGVGVGGCVGVTFAVADSRRGRDGRARATRVERRARVRAKVQLLQHALAALHQL